jgi:hypothetical protein
MNKQVLTAIGIEALALSTATAPDEPRQSGMIAEKFLPSWLLIIQAPMPGSQDVELCAAVCEVVVSVR